MARTARARLLAAAAGLALPVLIVGAAEAARSSYLLPVNPDNSYEYSISSAAGGVVVLGTETLQRLDDSGLPVWTIQPPGTLPLRYAKPLGLRDGDAIVTNLASPGGVQVTVSRLGADGSLRWAKRVDDPAANVVMDSCETAAGNLAVAWRDADGVVTVQSFAPTGDPRWMVHATISDLNDAGTVERDAFGLAAFDADSLVVALGTEEGVLLSRIEPSGDVGWTLLLPGIHFTASHASQTLADGSVAISLRLALMGASEERSLVLRVRGDGVLLAQAIVPGHGAMLVTRDGNLLVAAKDPSAWPNDMLLKLTPGVDVLWARRIALTGWGVHWAELGDGSLVGVSIIDPARFDFVPEPFELVAFLDSDGHADPGCAMDSDRDVTSMRTNVVPVRHPPAVTSSGGSADDVVTDWPLVATPTPLPWCSQDGCRADALEPDSCSRAPGNASAGPLRLNFCGDAMDVTTMAACAGVVNVVKTADLGPLADTVLEVWSADCAALLASDDDGGGGRASRVAFTPPADERLVVVIRQKDGSVGLGRDYTLTVEPAACDPPAWSARYFVDGAALQVRTFAAVDDAYVVAGSSPPLPLGSGPASVLMRLEADASVAWCRRLGHAGATVDVASVHALPAGEVAVAGTVSMTGGGDEGFLARIGADGSTISLQGMDDASFIDAHRDAAGWTSAASTGGWTNVMSTTDAGAVRWRIAMPADIRGCLIAPTADGGAIIAGHATMEPARGWLARVLPTGELAWQRWISVPTAISLDTVLLFVQSDGGNGAHVVVFGRDAAADWGVSVVDIDEAGGLVRETRFGPPPASAWPSLWPIGCSPGGDLIARINVSDVATGPGLAIIDRSGAVTAARLGSLNRVTVRQAAMGSDSLMFLDAQDRRELTRLRPSLQRAPECDDSSPTALTRLPPIVTVAPAFLPCGVLFTPITTPALTNSPALGTVLMGCSTLPCDPPTASIDNVIPANPCNGSWVDLRGSGTGRGTLTLEWDLDWDGVTFDVDRVGPWVSGELAAGPRDIALRVTDSCVAGPGQAIAVRRVDVSAAGVPVISGPTSYCAGDPCVTLSVPDAYDGYSWTGGSRGPSTCVAPATSTRYSVLVTAGSCSWTVEHLVTVDFQPLVASIRETCTAPDRVLIAEAAGGGPPFTFLWDTGETSQSIVAASGARSVTITDATGCRSTAAWSTTPECGPPGEVSGPGEPPLRLAGPALTFVSFAPASGARAYNLLVGRIGGWASPDASLSSCHLTSWGDDGTTLSIAATLPVNTWLVVTASNLSGEGPAGAGTTGERSASLAWIGCGASP